ncbi:MAG: L,D-transpeptidase family protein [Actinobacteria bacterium]|nr:L,D-transpeptidase family protein [Actinomycetota bacterium]
MARNLWRPSRFGLPAPVIGIVAAIVVLLIVVVLWVRGGCRQTAPQAPPDVPDIPAVPEVSIPPAPEPESITTPIEEIPPTPPPAPAVQPSIYQKYWEAGRDAFDRADYVNARKQLSQALKGIKDKANRKMIQVQLTTISNELTFSSHITPGDTTVESYHVKSGDLPSAIVKKYNITPELFLKINNIPNDRSMRADRSYKVIKGPFDIIIYKKNFQLDVFLGDYYIRSFAIGLGRDNSTPTGAFVAGDKLVNPGWWGVVDESTGRRVYVPHEDPKNPLGNHWISLRHLATDGGKQTDYGIHGTNEPQTIGKQASHGCIRMRNEDVSELFDLLVTGKSRITVIAD